MSRIEEVLKRASREDLTVNERGVPEPSVAASSAAAEPFWEFPADSPVGEAVAPSPLPQPEAASAAAEPFWEFPADSPVGEAVAPSPLPQPVAAPDAAEPLWEFPADSPVAELGAPIPLPPVASDPELRRRVPAIPEVQPVEMGADVLITRTQRLDAIEQYRKLGAALHEAQVENGLRALLCTSALMGEGKTVTACNLALTLSKSYGRRVLLIDADLRRPQIHTMFGIPNTVGLGDALTASEDTKLAVQQITPHLSVITAGTATSDPMTGLISERLRQVIAQASNRFDWVIIDTPPVLIVPDARVLVSIVDAVLLVVRAGSTPFRTVLRAVELIKRDRIFGTVLNCVEEATLDAEYGYDRYYAAAKPA